MYPLYRYAWRNTSSSDHELGGGPAPIEGFVPFLAAVMHESVTMAYYVGQGATIPIALLSYF